MKSPFDFEGPEMQAISDMAVANNWKLIAFQENIYMVSFKRGDVRINIYLSKMTVATCLNHPKKGKTQLFRKNVSLSDMARIVNNPRVHTNKGYHTKPKNTGETA